MVNPCYSGLVRKLDTAEGPAYVVKTRGDAAALWDWLIPRRSDYLGLDCETNAHDPWDQDFRLRTCQISDGETGWVIHAELPEIQAARVVETLVHAHPRWVAHYAGDSDLRFLALGAPGSVRLDSREAHISDTQTVLAYYDPRTVTGGARLDPRIRLDRALKPNVQRILGSTTLTEAESALLARFRELAPVGHRTAKSCKAWGFEHIDLDDEAYNVYAALDAMMEVRLWRKMLAEVTRRGQESIVLGDVRRQWHCDLMTLRGMCVDHPYTQWLADQFEQVVKDNMGLLAQHQVAVSGMGPSIGQALERLGVRSTRTTKTGAASWNGAALETITDNAHLASRPEHHTALALIKAVSLVRKSGKFRSAYLNPMLASVDLDGRVHPRYRYCGAVTGRNAAMTPPMHQIPKRSDKRLRPAFIASPGWVFVTSDFQRGEPSVMAAMSGDEQLRHDCMTSDLNGVLATRTYGDAYIADDGHTAGTISYEYRQRGKAGFLARCYGCAYRKLASLLRVSNEQAQDIMASWDAAYPRLAAYSAQVNALPAVTLLSGRVVPLWDRWEWTPHGLRDTGKPSRLGLNAIAQGEQADLLRRALDQYIDEGWSWSLAMLIHDEIVACVPEAMAEECRIVLEKCMTMELCGYPIRCEAEIVGPTWGKRPTEYDPAEVGSLVMGMDDE